MEHTNISENKVLLQSIIDSSVDTIQIFTAIRNREDKIIDFCWQMNNRNAFKQNGNVIGENVLKHNPGMIVSGIFGHMVQVMETGNPYEGEQYYSYEQFHDQWYYLAIVKHADKLIMTTRDITIHKRNEITIRESKELLQAVFDASINPVAYHKAVRDKTGKIIDFEFQLENFEARKYALSDRTGKRYSEAYPGIKDTVVFEKYVEVVETGHKLDTEVLLTIQGRPTWFRLLARKLKDGIVASAEDITKKKKAEKELVQAKEQLAKRNDDKYQALFNCIDEAFSIIEVIFNNEGIATDYRFLEVNKTFEKQTGIHAPVGKTARELVPKHEERWYEIFGEVALSRIPKRFEQKADALHRWYDVYAFPIGEPGEHQIAVLFNDIIERKQADEALRLSESQLKSFNESLEHLVRNRTTELHDALEQLRTLVNNTPDFITRWDKNSRLLFANPALEKKTGLAIKDIMGKTKLEMGLPENIALPWMDKLKMVREKKMVLDHYNTIPTPGGETIFFSYLVPEFDEHGDVTSVLAIGRNITELKNAENQVTELKLKQQKEILNTIIVTQEQERERIGEALHNGVAQLLYAIQTRIHLIKTLDDESEAHKMVAQSIIDQAIKDTRTVSFELVPSVLRDHGLIQAIKTLSGKIIQEPLKIFVHSEGAEKLIDESTKYALFRIAQELLNNIIRHSKATEGHILLKWSGGEVCMTVSDNGIGFDVKDTKIKGIGLQSIQNRIRLLDGSISIIADTGGTEITVVIPL